jgi:transposase
MASAPTVDLPQIRQVLCALLAAGKQEEALDAVLGLLAQLRDHSAALELRLRQLLRHQYGRRSEKLDPKQLSLLLAELTAAPAPPPATPPDAQVAPPAPAAPPTPPLPTAPPRRRPTGRKPLPAQLERREVRCSPSSDERFCAPCGRDKQLIGVERSEILEWVPGHFIVLVQVREKYACTGCEAGVVIGPTMDKPIEGGLPGPNLLTHILVSKYKDHAPLNRLADMLARAGVELAPSTLGDWVRQGAELLEAVYHAIYDRVLTAHVVQADDTGLRVLDRSHPAGIKKGHIYGLVGDGQLVVFAYTPTWSGAEARALLQDRRGWLQADGYAGFDQLFTGPDPPMVEVGCMAHNRRKYVAALDSGDLRAAVPVGIIAKLYQIEDEAKARGPDAAGRLALRQEKSAPLMTELGQWIAQVHPTATPKSPLGKALTYSVNQWRALNRFLEDGALELDNNGVERALRAIAVGRHNWLFAGSDAGARRAAILYSLFGSCALCGVEPFEYLRDVIEKLSGNFPMRRVGELVPNEWARRRDQERDALAAATATA